MVCIDSNKEVYCDELGGHMSKCEFMSLLANSQVCGNCPLMKASEEVIDVLFEGAISDMGNG